MYNSVINKITATLRVKNFKQYKEYATFSEIRKTQLDALTVISQEIDPHRILGYAPFFAGYRNLLLHTSQTYFSGVTPPVFAISRDLLEAFLLTDLPKDPINLHPSFKNALILLPKGFFKTPEYKLDINHLFLTAPSTDNQLRNDYHKFINLFFDTDYDLGHRFFDIASKQHYHFLNIARYQDYQNFLHFDHDFATKRDLTFVDVPTESQQEMNKIKDVVFQILFYLQIQPESDTKISETQTTNLVDIGNKLTRKERQRNSMSDFIWLDLPENKKVYSRSDTFETSSIESKRDVSTHWRRGHWRNQPIGEKRQDSKLIWIRPSLINPV